MTDEQTKAGGSSSVEWRAFGPYRLLIAERVLKRDGLPVQIGDQSMDLLLALTETPGEIFSKQALAERVWRRPFIEDGSLRVAVGALRKVLGRTSQDGDYVVNVVGRGYGISQAVTVTAGPERDSIAAASSRKEARLGRLPPLLNRVFGRRKDIGRVGDLLSERRIVTIVGAGGIGKTTAAISCASFRAADGGDVCFVDLAPIRDPALVPSRIAAALGADPASPDPLGFIGEHLASRRLLLVLDNAEHLAEATAAVVDEIASDAPGVAIIVTSREPLGASGETVYRLEPLALPPAGRNITAAEALEYDSVELFVDRVQANAPDFVLTDETAPAAAGICRRLDGVALAIRLAAGRVPAFGVNGIASLLEDRFRLLSQNQRGGPSRHQTLEAAFDWSFDNLLPDEQSLLARVSVFSHSFGLEAVLDVAADPHGSSAETFATIGDLVAKSLVVFVEDEEGAGYRLLETVRVFALARLEAGGAGADVARRHARHVIARCGTYQSELDFNRHREAAVIGRATVDDARAALHRAMAAADWPLASDLVHAAGSLLVQLGFAREMVDWLDRLLAERPDPRERLALLISLGGALWLATPEDVRTIEVYAEAYELARSLGDGPARLRAAWSLILSTCSARRPPAAIRAAAMLIEDDRAEAAAGSDDDAVMIRMLAGVSRHLLGDYAACERSLRWLMEHRPADQRAAAASAYLYDPRHIGQPFLAWIEFFSGRLSDAAETSRCIIVDAGDHVPSIANNILRSAFPIAVDSGHWEQARAYVDALARHCGDGAAWRAWTDALRDVLAIRFERSSEALDRFDAFVTGGEGFGGFRRQTWYYMRLVKGCLSLGRNDRAEELLREVLAFVETTEDNWWRPEMVMLDGHLAGRRDPVAAYGRYQEAIVRSRDEGSTLIELRGALAAMRVAPSDLDRKEARRQSREAFGRLLDLSPKARERDNLRLLRSALCVCRAAQRRLLGAATCVRT